MERAVAIPEIAATAVIFPDTIFVGVSVVVYSSPVAPLPVSSIVLTAAKSGIAMQVTIPRMTDTAMSGPSPSPLPYVASTVERPSISAISTRATTTRMIAGSATMPQIMRRERTSWRSSFSVTGFICGTSFMRGFLSSRA